MPNNLVHEYIGVIHCHSVFSDGSAYPDEIAKIANEVGLDFLVLTDHNTLRAKNKYERIYGKTHLFVGTELNDKNNKNHYLAIGIDKSITTRISANEYVKKINELGGFGFIAHPDECRNFYKEYPPFPWDCWECEDFTGIEIWNHMSEWLENLNEENKYYNVRHPRKSLNSPKDITLKRWDELNLTREVVGVAGADAHAHKVNILGMFQVEIFPYKVMFLTLRNHIWLENEIKYNAEEFEKNRSAIYNALKNGKLFFANDYIENSKGFKFYGQFENQTIFSLATIPLEKKPKLFIEIPSKNTHTLVLHNSKIKYEVKENYFEFIPNEKGVYRVEVLKDNKKWIFSNPIRII
jgi:hypothetical protein